MEYIRPLRPLSFCQKTVVFFRDILFICTLIRRFVDDHLLSRQSPMPQPMQSQSKPIYMQTSKEKNRTIMTSEVESSTSSLSSCLPDAPVGSFTPRQLRVLNLNIWGLPISPRTEVRVSELAKSFHLFDIIAFQECSHEREVRILREKATVAGLKYQHQFTNGVGFPIWHGVTAPGLVVLSRFPILDMHYRRYSINGKMYQCAHLDYMLAKGVGLVRVDVSQLAYPDIPAGQCRPVVGVDVFLTHLHANYTNFFYDWRKWLPILPELESRLKSGEDVSSLSALMPIPLLEHVHDEYLAHRVLQAYECARFIASFRRDDFLTLLCGDLNCPQYDLCMQLIQAIPFGQSCDDQHTPRFIDSFREVHPDSNGFTCGAHDNTFTFSTEPIRMERRKLTPHDETLPSVSGIHHHQSYSVTPTSAQVNSTAASVARRRARFNTSPIDATLVPADGTDRPRTKYGEHIALLPSSSNTNDDETDEQEKAQTPASDLGPLHWPDDDTPKRIDYVLYANPSTRLKCSCVWRTLDLPFQTVTDDAESALRASCTCPPLPAASSTWSVAAATVFKPYMMSPDGKMTSISDHHGLSVVFQFNAPDQPKPVSTARQPTSTIIISQLPNTDGSVAPPAIAPVVPQSPKLALRKKTLPDANVGDNVNDEDALFTLADDSTAPSSIDADSDLTAAPVFSRATSNSRLDQHLAPPLPTSSILLLCEGVLWFGLRDASDRRVAHLTRMLHAFMIFIIGSRTMWMYLLNRYFESVMADLLPLWFLEFPFPSSFLALMRLLLFVIDWAHTFLPIYIVLEYLLTTFPAKEEQSTMREGIAEMTRLRHYNYRSNQIKYGQRK